VFLVFAAGVTFLLLSLVICAPGTVLFVMSRREQNRRLFSPAELVLSSSPWLAPSPGSWP